MKKIRQIISCQLSILATLVLCATANNYASDIEIYKAPTAADGNAKIMLVLDVSTYMYQDPANSGGSISDTPTDADFGVVCNGSNKSFPEVRNVGTSYEYTAYFCETQTNSPIPAVINGCFTSSEERPYIPTTSPTTYRCYDRLSTLKESLIEIVDNVAFWAADDPVAEPNKPKISLGFSFFPTGGAFGSPMVPQLLNAAGRHALKIRISDLKPGESLSAGEGLPFPQTENGGKQAQVAQAYARGVKTLIDSVTTSSPTSSQCTGYGVYTLTGGIPDGDVLPGPGGAYELLSNSLNVSEATSQLNSVCNVSGGSTTGGVSWQCVEKAAELFKAGKSSLGVPLHTAVVSMGKGFGFYGVNAATDFDLYTASTTLQSIDQRYTLINTHTNNSDKPVLLDRYRAIRSGTVGGGGYYAVSNGTDLKQSIEDFIARIIQVNIPYITTGAPTIPQDPLNPALVQQNAYYSQFKPTPRVLGAEGSRLWLGNLKKYRINALGRLIDKNDSGILNLSTGELMTNYDYWSPPVSTDSATAGADENTPGSDLFARMGGVKSQLPVGTSMVEGVQVENRKLLTNRTVNEAGVASEVMSLNRINRDTYASNDPKRSDLMSLLDLRQVGAVMHSSPLLLSNKGKMVYNATTDTLGTTNREDYVLFGSTQGLLHVVKADDYAASAAGMGNGGGKEVFAFVPHEMIENQSKAFLTPDATTGGSANLFYGIDAPWTVYTEYVVDGSGNLTVGTGKAIDGGGTLKGKQLVYGGLRMGGRSYYSLDLGDMSSPKLKFHINPDAHTTGPLSYMGQSWSKPKVAWVKWNGSRKLVMFVGGGYDAGGATGNANNGGYEGDNYDQTNGIGAGVYMFDALNGDLLWWASSNATATSAVTDSTGVIALKDADLKYSVASEIKTADRNNDGLVDHLYFGDLGGQVFRIDLNNNAAAIGAFATRSVRLLNLHQLAGKSPRFYAMPAFSIYKDKDSGNLFAAISIGSGNLSRPLLQYNEGERDYDALYTIYDKDVARADLFNSSIILNTQNVALTGTSILSEITNNNRFANTTLIAPYASSSGWYFQFKGSTADKPVQQEKVFYAPTVIDNDLYVSSYDSDKLMLKGTCGGGVQGESKVRLFCMPFGQCAASRGFNATNSISSHGPGIQNHAIGGIGGAEGGTTRIIGGAILDNNLDDKYETRMKFIPQRWYEKY